jgi:hypothetical protein
LRGACLTFWPPTIADRPQFPRQSARPNAGIGSTSTKPIDLTDAERDLLAWLAREDFECRGHALDALIAKRLAQVHGPGEHQAFIAIALGFIMSARKTDSFLRASSCLNPLLVLFGCDH